VRRAITAFFRLCLQIYFRRVELMGLSRVPDHGAVIFAANHPNGLVDPLFLLCFAPRPVSFLAKAPLFRYPVIGWFVRAFDSIPVYRKEDGTSGSNLETFARARELLHRECSLAIFPEGTTHDDPSLRELKTGAARIALGAGIDELTIVPTGIYYTAKHRFRSSALVVFGEPIRVAEARVGSDGKPAREDVDRLTAEIDAGLDSVTLQADSHAALELIARAEDIFTGDARQPLTEEFDLQRKFIEGYHFLRERDPDRLERLEAEIAQLDAELRRARLDVHELTPQLGPARLFRLLVLLPLALAGALLNYLPYRLVAMLSVRFYRGEEHMVATVKFLAALAFYPLIWIVIAIAIGLTAGPVWGVAALTALPFLGYIALRAFEEIDDVIGDLRAVTHRLFRKHGHARLLEQLETIRREMRGVAREMR
jgi:glycerol-3-phosphate O-acyltransferase / dihydroxyacetone phosphate acyltransferase